MTHSEYVAYGRNLATRHKDILHVEGDSGQMHFARIILSADPMGGDNIEEFLQSVRNKLKFPFVLWVAYDHSYRGDRNDNIQKIHQGAFIILMHPAKGKFDQEEAAYDKSEKIGEDFLSFIKHDFATKMANRYVFIDDATGEKIGPVVDNFVGMRYSFSFQKTANQALHFNPDIWL